MIKFTQKQSKLWDCLNNPQYRRYLIDGGARAGKTLCIVGWLLNQMATIPGLRVACLRQHRNHARTTLFDGTIKQLLRGRTDFTFEETTMEIHHNNGSIMRIDGLDDASRVDKILGDEFAHIFINEASQVSYQAVKVAISRLAQNLPNLTKRNLIMDCNPKGTLHWLYRWGVMGLDPETNEPIKDKEIWSRMSFLPTDNPYLPKDAIESLKNLSGVEYKRLFEGQWVSVEGLAYPCFSIEQNIKNIDRKLSQSWILGVDCGNKDPMVLALFMIYMNENNQKALHMIDLYHNPGNDMSISLADVAEKWKELDPYCTVDPSASPAIVELKARGFRCEAANNKLKDGITIMRDLIATGRLSFQKEYSEKLIEEINQYELNPKTELPIGNTPDHILDATRYACCAFSEGSWDNTTNFYIF